MARADAAMVVDYERMAEQVRAVQREIAGISETSESDDGLIAATVDARGELVDLRLDPRIFRQPDSSALAAEVLHVYRDAREAAQCRAFEASAALLPRGATRAGTDLDFDPALHELDRLSRARGEDR
ncbi:YbaB/EbfC family nucleoid-associated protein [Saccharopolyspora indica]|uniref:YbaB/EbfC family nucleoid-associated protein n=1 Tax=Saccharopolyspora indica TaxID=1229659 RepID=UPI0022EA7184|nr:YbaB/EbfC family nucleoid-associated protein [Saccharopolyspora indica]MDA3647208.1 YbaB/EbfC family nucleoid-associated protein [Saccharopolyspora indica]